MFVGTYPATLVVLVLIALGIGAASMSTPTFRNLLTRMEIPISFHMRIVDVIPYEVISFSSS